MTKRARTDDRTRASSTRVRRQSTRANKARTETRRTNEANVLAWIVWQDAGLLAVDKPAGIASQGGDGLAGINLVDLARAQLGIEHVAVLHRIDRNVSGIVLLAKTTVAARAMSQLIAAGKLERRYQAVVKGRLTAAVELRHWLRKDSGRNQVELVDAPKASQTADAPKGAQAADAPKASQTADAPAGHKLSVTRVAPIAEVASLLGVCTQVHAWPITGRSHQIRAQLAAHGHPILGDPKYGVEAKGLHRPLLHAEHVAFVHPITSAPIDITVPPPWTHDELLRLRRR